MITLSCFKAYDVRGRLDEELNPDIAYRIGRAFAQHLRAKCVAVGCDIRLSGEALKSALSRGLSDAGADVIDLGMTGTEEIYHAALHLDIDGGVEVTASHNPKDYNGMKFIGRDCKPLAPETDMLTIRELAETQNFCNPQRCGKISNHSILPDYIDHILGYIDLTALTPLTVVTNAGNGAAGHVIDAIEARFTERNVPVNFVKIHHEPDGHFPNGVPNPLLIENRTATSAAVRNSRADFGIAWDGDFDRCFLFDEQGEFIEGYYIVGLLAEAFLTTHSGAAIVHDARVKWNTIDIAQHNGGRPIETKTGHSFIKQQMRIEDAIYGGEMSAHHYFRDFGYCDSGMIPWLLISELISKTGQSLSQLVGSRIGLFPCSGEINFKVADAAASQQRIHDHFQNAPDLKDVNMFDGLSMEFSDWRFNLRSSNTEPLLRLNLEARGQSSLVDEKLQVIRSLVESECCV